MAKKRIYKIIFTNQGKVFEIYARQVISGELYGFVEAQGLLFGERTTLVVDPSEEQLKLEFNGVNKTYIPFHTIVRIDEVEKEGTGKILQLNSADKSGIQLQHPSIVPGKGPERT
jgi:hypothetical protein